MKKAERNGINNSLFLVSCASVHNSFAKSLIFSLKLYHIQQFNIETWKSLHKKFETSGTMYATWIYILNN